METIIKIQRLHFKEKLSQREIATRLNISRTTIQKYIKQSLTKPPSYQRQHIHYPKLGSFYGSVALRKIA